MGLGGCTSSGSEENKVITVDVTKNYSTKKELILQDFMDVEYIALETNDEFVNQGRVEAIGKDVILVTNYKHDGTIYVYDRTGKAIRKINRKGQGGEEYIFIHEIVLDDDNDEMFINDIPTCKIKVYDLYGNYKRSLKHYNSDELRFYTSIFNYDKENLICNSELDEEAPFVLISKQDGSITKKIDIPYKEKILPRVYSQDENGDRIMKGTGVYSTIIPYYGNSLICENSSDTVYTFLPDHSMRPFLVRTPSIQSMEPKVFLFLRMISDRYYFMEAITNTYNFETEEGFSKTFLMYDNQEKRLCGYKVYNADYTNKEEIYMNFRNLVNHEIESWYPIEAHQLIESYEAGHLQGKLKEIAATLNEESNRVIMLIKHKKEE